MEPQMNTDGAVPDRLTQGIIGCAIAVSNGRGPAFVAKVYESALAHGLRKAGLAVAQQRGVSGVYDGVAVGVYAVDLLVEDRMIVELKAVRALDTVHQAQCITCLRATDLRSVCC